MMHRTKNPPQNIETTMMRRDSAANSAELAIGLGFSAGVGGIAQQHATE